MGIPASSVEGAASTVLNQGILGALLVLSLAALVGMFMLYRKSMEARVKEGQEQVGVNDRTADALESMTKVIEATFSRRGR